MLKPLPLELIFQVKETKLNKIGGIQRNTLYSIDIFPKRFSPTSKWSYSWLISGLDSFLPSSSGKAVSVQAGGDNKSSQGRRRRRCGLTILHLSG